MHDHESDPSAETQPRVIYHWRTPRTVLTGALLQHDRAPPPDELLIPSLHLRGMWMTTAGIEAGTRLSVQIAPGCLLLRTLTPVVRVACRPGWYQARQRTDRVRW
jgi:toxic protein SymE